MKTPAERIEELEKVERLRWAFRLRRRAVAGLMTVYAIGVLLQAVPASLKGVGLILFVFVLNEIRQWRFDRGHIAPTTLGFISVEVLAISFMIYSTGGVESVLIPISLVQVVAVSIHLRYEIGWRAAYLHVTFFAIFCLLEFYDLIPHAPMMLSDDKGNPLYLSSTWLMANGANAAFRWIVLVTCNYGFMLSISAYASGYIIDKLKIRESLLEKTHRMLASIYRLSSDLMTHAELSKVGGVMAEWIVEELGVSRTMVVIQKRDRSTVVSAYPPALFTDHEIEGARQRLPAESKVLMQESWEILPMKAGNKLLGHVYLARDREVRSEDRSLLNTALNHFKTSVEKALYVEEVVSLAVTDGMTEIANRRHFTQTLEREIPRATRHRQPLSLLLVDVDHFKKVNDVHGHLMGDTVLKGVAQILQGCIRQTDMAARYGGEEFVILAPSTDLDSVRVLAERIRERVAACPFQQNGTRLNVTVSLGMAELSQDQAQNSDDLIAIADRRLYIAKREGRNRAISHG